MDTKKNMRFGKYDLTRMLNAFPYQLETITDKVGQMNSYLSLENVVRTGSASGEFEVKKLNEEKVLKAIVKDYNGDTFNADYHMFPAILTHYDARTKEILFTELFLNTTCSKVSANEPETKKNTEFVQYSWNSEDYFQINRKNYVYVDEFTATSGENATFSLTKEVSEDATTPIYYVLVDYEFVPDTDYTITTSGEGVAITFDEEVKIENGNNVMVVYETNLTTIQ